MAGTNKFYPFDEAQTNTLSDDDYVLNADRADGFKAGIAPSRTFNKVLRQSSVMSSAWGQVLSDFDMDADDSSVTTLANNLKTLVGQGGGDGANTDLSNLTPTGENHFLGNNRVANCILSNDSLTSEVTTYQDESYVNLNCTDTSGVFSGFSVSNYLILNKTFPNGNIFEFVIPFNLTATSGVQTIVAINNYENSIGIENNILTLHYNGNRMAGETVLATNTDYILKFSKSTTGYTLELRQESEEDYNVEITLPVDIDFFAGKSIILGSDRTHYLNGSIDLNNTSIYSESTLYWNTFTTSNFQTVKFSGEISTLMPNGRNENQTLKNEQNTQTVDSILLFNNTNTNDKTILLKNDGELMIRDNYTEETEEPSTSDNLDVWYNPNTNIMAENQSVIPNIINTGVTFTDDGVTGFSSSAYLELPSTYTLGRTWSITLPVNFQSVSGRTENVILGDYTKDDDGNIIPDGIAVVYDGNATVTAYLRRNDVYNVQKQEITSVAYEVTYNDELGYTSTVGSTGEYVATGVMIYSDQAMSVEIGQAQENTWQYTGNTYNNTQLLTGYTKVSGTVFVPNNTQIYSDADLKNASATATGSDWVYTGDKSTSMIGNIPLSISQGLYTLQFTYDGATYTFGTQTLESTDYIHNDVNIYIGAAPSTPNAYFNSMIDFQNANFSFYTWNGISSVSPNFEVVGDLTLDNGILSGFSTTSYVSIPQIFNPGASPWEFIISIITPTDLTETSLNILGKTSVEPRVIAYNIWNSGLDLYISSDGVNWDIASKTASFTFSPNTKYYIKTAFDGDQYTQSIATEPGSYQTLITVTSSTLVYNTLEWSPNLGFYNNTGEGISTFTGGSIDLNETYININGQRWWQWNGIGFNDASWNNFVGAKIGSLIVQQEQPQSLQPNVTIVGNLTENEGILSGFSTTSYATIPALTIPNGPWEMKFHFNTGEITTTDQVIAVSRPKYTIFIKSTHFSMGFSTNGTSWDIPNSVGTYTIQPNTEYFIKINFTGTAYTLSYSLTDEEDSYVTDITISNSTPITNTVGNTNYLGVRQDQQYPFSGSFNLNECYIKSGDNYLWQGMTMQPSVKKPNINIVGSLVNNNGVFSGFSTANYATTMGTLPSTITSYEFVAKFTTGATTTTQQGILANYLTNIATPQIVLDDSNVLFFNHPINSSTWATAITFQTNLNTTYYVKQVWNGNTISAYYKTSSDSDYTLVGTSNATTINWVEQVGIGIDTTSFPFLGTIDLNESYIKINNELWWKWNGVTETTYETLNVVDTISIDKPLELMKSTSTGVGGSTQIGDPIFTLSNTLGNNEIWLEGAVVSRALYPKLFEIYGTTYGGGDGLTTFQLPDFRNRAVWGGTTFGYLSAGLPNITGRFAKTKSGGESGCFYRIGSGGINSMQATSGSGSNTGFEASRSNTIYGRSSTVQPPSIKVRVKTRYR